MASHRIDQGEALLSRREMARGLVGLAALSLAGCAGQVAPRPRATARTVTNPREFGLDAVIDVSHSSSVTDFALARQVGGVLGVLHKASEGCGWADPLYDQRRSDAEAAGLMWGAYHFGTHQHPGGEQAAAFLAAAKPGPATLLALDLELNERNPANSMDLWQAEEFAAAILGASGRLPLLYVRPSWADGEPHAGTGYGLGAPITTDSILAGCDLWLADYRTDPELPRAWTRRGWRLWQYAGDGGPGGSGPFGPLSRAVAGVASCDRNLFRGDQITLARYWGAPASV
jgi:lysozyme